MPQITVNNVSEDVIAYLEARASANHRSLEREIRILLVRHTRGAALRTSASARRDCAR